MQIKLLTEYVDKIFNQLKESFLNEETLQKEFQNNPFLRFIILIKENKIVGYISFSHIYDKLEINYITIDNENRNLGYASLLLDYLINYASKNQIKNITLEVNMNNAVALHLYHKFGFKKVAIRKGYYHGIDGILMERKMM